MTTKLGSRHSGRLIVGQGVLLFGGYGAAQALALLRNAFLAHLLSKGDFGIAAALTITLQLLEMLSDPAADRLIMQTRDADIGRLIATAHVLNVARGLLIGVMLFSLAPLFANLFAIPEATSAFRALAVVPVIRAGLSLDWRRAQRELRSWPAVKVELLPQLVALALTYPAVAWAGDYTAVIWVTIAQALTQLVVTHRLAGTGYRLTYDSHWFRRILAFTWPALISAVTLLAVFQGDRVIVGRVFGMEVLAAYSVVFVLTMVPAALVGRAGTSLLLPIFAVLDRQPELRRTRLLLSVELAVVVAALYLVVLTMLGGEVIAFIFGPNYAGLGTLAAVLAGMWALRMAQTPLTSLMLAAGRPHLLTVGGFVRASAIVMAVAVAALGGSLVAIAATGVVGEALAMAYHVLQVRRIEPSLDRQMLGRLAVLPVVAVLVGPLADAERWFGSGLGAPAATCLVLATLGICLLVAFRDLRQRLASVVHSYRGGDAQETWQAGRTLEVRNG
ncbi:MAG: oligosaccharide flippase family protein [Hyphomicrobiaceae bacterium]